MADLKPAEFWAVARFYEPFHFGGNLWVFRRYKVTGEPVLLHKRLRGFAFMQNNSWKVHHIATGGFLGDGKTKSAAVKKANHNIDITPDLKRQIEVMGNVTNFGEIEREEAERRLAKSKKGKHG